MRRPAPFYDSYADDDDSDACYGVAPHPFCPDAKRNVG